MPTERRPDDAIPATESAIDALLMDLAERAHAGEAIDLQACCAQYPEHADELRRVLPTLLALADYGQSDVSPPAPLAAIVPHDPYSPGTLGDFRIVREIGRGGMGVVYEAEQISLKRRVALKVLPFAAILDNRQLQRFRTEAMAAARLHHEHIVPVYQVGCDRAVHFYAMQYIDGRNVSELIQQTRRLAGMVEQGASDVPEIATQHRGAAPGPAKTDNGGDTGPFSNISTDYSDDRNAYHRKVAELGVQAAGALEFAHQHGVLHRDIKPSNLMLDAEGKLWVTDFGLARIEGDDGLTMSGDLLGTLRYMSPEQALGKRVIVDQRTDVYSLGVSLYEMLTLKPAYAGSDRAALLRQISFEAPAPLRRLDPKIPADLETIVQTAMAREPHRRYETAQELADDLQRFLDNKPIVARRPSRTARLQKWVVRNKPLSLSLGLVLAAAMLAGYGTWLVNQGREPANAGAEGAFTGMGAPRGVGVQLVDDRESGQIPRGTSTEPAPVTSSPRNDAATTGGESDAPAAAVADVQAAPMPPAVAPEEFLPGLIPTPTPIPDVGRWQLITRRPQSVVRSAVWSPDEERYAFADGNLVRIHDAATHDLVHVLLAHNRPVRSVAWHPDGTRLASCSEDGNVRIWTSGGAPTHLLTGHDGPVYQVAWRPDGTQLASCGADGMIRLWGDHGQPIRNLDERTRQVFAIDWHPDGRRLASVGGEITGQSRGRNSINIWNADTGDLERSLNPQVDHSALCVDWNHDGSKLAVGFGHIYRSMSWLGNPLPDAGVRIWNADGTPDAAIGRDRGSISAVAWSPDSQQILFGGREGFVHHWSGDTRRVTILGGRHSFDLNSIAWNRWGTKALTTSRQYVREDDPALGEAVQRVDALKFKLQTVKWRPDGEQIAVDGKFFWSPDGTSLPADMLVTPPSKWWERDSHLERPDGAAAPRLELNVSFPIDYNWKFAWSRDGWLAGATWWDHAVRIWDDQGQLRSTLRGHVGGVESVAWSPDGTMLVSGGGDSVHRWQRDGTPILPVLRGHTDEIYPVEWSPDGRWIASGSTDSTVRLWRNNGTPGTVLTGHQGGIFALAWSPDARKLASASWLDNTLRVWDITTGKTLWLAIQLDKESMVSFTAGGHVLTPATSIDDGQLLCVVEQPDGSMQILNFREFRERYARQLNSPL